jgi:hypothetical protein
MEGPASFFGSQPGVPESALSLPKGSRNNMSLYVLLFCRRLSLLCNPLLDAFFKNIGWQET